LQVRALPGAKQVPEPICRRFTPQKLTLAKRLLAKVLPLLRRPPFFLGQALPGNIPPRYISLQSGFHVDIPGAQHRRHGFDDINADKTRIPMKYMISWFERPQGSSAEYENAQKRILEVFTQWKAPANLKIELFVVRLGEWGGHMLVDCDDPLAIHKVWSTQREREKQIRELVKNT
jgi:hypothetical protein